MEGEPGMTPGHIPAVSVMGSYDRSHNHVPMWLDRRCNCVDCIYDPIVLLPVHVEGRQRLR